MISKGEKMLILLLQIIAALVIVGVVLWALTQFPIDPTIAKIIKVVIIVIVAIWVVYVLLALAGATGGTVGTVPRLLH
jgi:hypothetical protein